MMTSAFDATTTTVELGERMFGGSLEAERALFARGAAGDLEALRILLDATLIAQNSNLVPYLLSGCEVLGRLTASYGEAPDRMRLAGILALRASEARACLDHDIAEAWEAETLGLLNELAEEGHEEAADTLNVFADLFSPAAAIEARAASQKPLPAALVADLVGCAPVEQEAQSSAPPVDHQTYFTKLRLAIGQLCRALLGNS